jgi:hypothetical protein
MLRNRLSNFEDRMRFAGVKDDSLANPLVVYFFRPGQITQASVVIFLELSVTHVIRHAEKYPSPILPVAIPSFVTKNIDVGRCQKRTCRSSWITVFTRPREMGADPKSSFYRGYAANPGMLAGIPRLAAGGSLWLRYHSCLARLIRSPRSIHSCVVRS